MTVSLGGITLSDDLRLTGTKNQPRIAGNVRITLGGRAVAQGTPIASGRQLVLEAVRDGDAILGYFTGTQVDQICTLRDNMTTAALVHHLGTFQVIVTAVDVDDLKGVADPAAAAEYFGTITMIEV
jgi:hypothetical protein